MSCSWAPAEQAGRPGRKDQTVVIFSPSDIGHSRVGGSSRLPVIAFCISCFSAVGIKHHSQGKFIKDKPLTGLMFERESMIVDPRNGGQTAESSHPEAQAGSTNSNWHESLETSKPAPRDILLPARPHLVLPRQLPTRYRVVTYVRLMEAIPFRPPH